MRKNNQNLAAQTNLVLYGAIAFSYVILGLTILYIMNVPTLRDFPAPVKIAFALLCIAYGVFRLFRAWSRYKNETKNDE